MLEPNNRHVQGNFVRYFFHIDDTAMWQVMDDIYSQVLANIKLCRKLRQVERDVEDLRVAAGGDGNEETRATGGQAERASRARLATWSTVGRDARAP